MLVGVQEVTRGDYEAADLDRLADPSTRTYACDTDGPTSPHSEPWAGGSSRSLTTTIRGARIVRTYE
jgi:hypothetical protein